MHILPTCPGDCQGHSQRFPGHRVLADAQPLRHIPAEAHHKCFWQWFCLGWENSPADSAAASILRRQQGAFSAQPPGTEPAAQEPSRDQGEQSSLLCLASSESRPPRPGTCPSQHATPSPAQLWPFLAPFRLSQDTDAPRS